MNIRTVNMNGRRVRLPHIQMQPQTIRMATMKEILLTIGIPASGKSSYIKNKLYDSHIRVNRDMINNLAKEQTILTAILSTNMNVVIDRTNLTQEVRARFINLAKMYKYNVIGLIFDTPIEVCLERNKKRNLSTRVPEKIMKSMQSQLEQPSLEEGINQVIRVPFTEEVETQDEGISLR